MRRELAGEAGLADARVALEHDELGVGRRGGVGSEQRGELTATADEGTAALVVHAYPGDRRRVERGIVAEDGELEVAQLSAGFEPELVAQGPAGRSEGVERLGLAPGSVQGEGEPGVQPFAQRVLGRQRAQLADDLS